MLFNSSIFIYCFLIFIAVYQLAPVSFRTVIVLAFSLFFYGYFDPRFLVLLVFTTTLDFFAAFLIDRLQNQKWRNTLLVATVSINMFFLLGFKFIDVALKNFLEIFGSFEWDYNKGSLLIPLGISFYTFQSLSYVFDVYKKQVPAEKNYLVFMTFITYFPQLIAGPIEKAKDLMPQIKNFKSIELKNIEPGAWLFFWGLFKKVFVADNLAPYTIWGLGQIPVGAETFYDSWLVVISAGIRFYCDFSGYSDMARGLSQIVGIKITINFNQPFFSTSLNRYWSRWHITLSRWFLEYVYGPLRRALGRGHSVAIPLIVMMTLIGLWHGNHIRYTLWGFLWGVVLVSERQLRHWCLPSIEKFVGRNIVNRSLFLGLAGILTFAITLSVNVFFVVPEIGAAFDYVKELWDFSMGTYSRRTYSDFLTVLYYVGFWFLIEAVMVVKGRDEKAILDFAVPVKVTIFLIILFYLMTSGANRGVEFIYFQF